MFKNSKEKLISLLKEGKVIPFIGAGVSVSSSGLPSWSNLIQNGLEYARVRNIDIDGDIEKAQLLLSQGKFLEASNHLKKVLNAPSFPFVNWIKDVFENVEINSKDLINSILDLNQKTIFTTNYDTLLSSIDNLGNRQKIIHSDYEIALNEIKSENEIIMHLHGIHEKPESIILSKDDYDSLNKNAGYKAFLKKMFSDYHILFIGCSKDGVMDEDFSVVFEFVKEWFSISGNQHYILLNQKEIENQNHVKLLTEGNIESISFGYDYNELSPFINSINPNYAEKELKLKETENKLKSEFERIEKITNKFTINKEQIDVFISSNLSSEYDWVDSEKMKIFEKILLEYNELISTKKEKMIFIQDMIRSLFKASELKEKLDLWMKYGDEPSKLDPLNYITTAIFAFESLGKIPKEIITDLKFANWTPIHNYYFTGYLGSFINEIKNYKSLGFDLTELYEDDKYLFENLKRIIHSLNGFLEINATEFYQELEQAIIAKTIPDSFVAMFTNSEISIRLPKNINEIIAKLPIENNTAIYKIDVIKHNNVVYVIGFNSKESFFWCPQTDLAYTTFFKSEIHEEIHDIFCSIAEKSILISLKVGQSIVTFKDFNKIEVKEIDHKFISLLPLNDSFIAIVRTDINHQGDFLFKLDSNLKSKPLFSIEELTTLIKTEPNISKILSHELEEEITVNGLLNLIDNVNIHPVSIINRQLFILTIRVRINGFTSCMVLIEIVNDKINVLLVEYLPISVSIALDFCQNEEDLRIFCGYLDMKRQETIAELFEYRTLEKKNSKSIIKKRENQSTRDILRVKFIDFDTVLMQEENNILIYSISTNNFKEYTFEEDEIINYVNFFELI